MSVTLRGGNDVKNDSYERVDFQIKERGVYGDLAISASLTKGELQKLVDFLRRCEQVLK